MKLQCMIINSVPWFVIAHNVLLEGAITVALNTDKLLPPAGMMLQEQNHQEQSGHTSFFFFYFTLKLNLAENDFILIQALPNIMMTSRVTCYCLPSPQMYCWTAS